MNNRLKKGKAQKGLLFHYTDSGFQLLVIRRQKYCKKQES